MMKQKKKREDTMTDREYERHCIMNSVYYNFSNSPKITDVFNSSSFAGQKVFIVGGGESLKNFDFSKLAGQKVITINLAFEQCPSATINYAMDSDLYDKIIKGKLNAKHPNLDQKWFSFNGRRVFLTPMEQKLMGKEVLLVMRLRNKVVSKSLEEGVYGESNSGLGAIQLAVAMGAEDISLLGFDMKCKETSHFHGGYCDNRDLEQFNIKLNDFKNDIGHFAPVYQHLGIKIRNCNPDSDLKCFPFANIDEVLNESILQEHK